MTVEIVAPAHGEIDALRLRERDVPVPGPRQVLVAVRAAGVNPSDWKSLHRSWPRDEPMGVGSEAAGVVAAIGAEAAAERAMAVGDEVIACPVPGAYASHLLVPADDVLPKPRSLDFAQAANLLVVGTTAAEMLAVTKVRRDDTIVVHGASGATGVSVLQQAAQTGARVVATASERNFDLVRSLGSVPVTYGPGLEQRIRDAAQAPVDAALDCVGTVEAIDTSLALVGDRTRVVSIAGADYARERGVRLIGGWDPDSLAFRKEQRPRLIDMAERGILTVPMARTLPLTVEGAHEAFAALRSNHPGGKLALICEQK
ncbi:quinone oxidoreductase family protein [Streptomyces sp. JW3]|uniref:quinone oxidoreductase family protein n=1 Tax=Streptomyces sp. JW3 TaxID=3456955 RepID=UPI003FA4B20D